MFSAVLSIWAERNWRTSVKWRTDVIMSRPCPTDVYAIAMHPDKPFVAVTCSRDTTMRYWSTEELCPSARLRAVLGADVTTAATAGGVPAAATDAGKRTMVGKAIGERLKQRLADAGGAAGGGGGGGDVVVGLSK